MAPVMAREIRGGSPTSRLAAEAGARLLAAGYHQQVPVRPGFLNLFVVMEGERRALGLAERRRRGARPRRGGSRRRGAAALERDPRAWSPGVLLRPLAQDLLLPTAAYVGGPAEIAYHAQIGPSYAHFGIPRPVLVPRPSVTLVEPAQARALEAEGLSLVGPRRGTPRRLVARWAREAYPEVEAAFARAREAMERDMSRRRGARWPRSTRRCGPPPTRRGAAPCTRSRRLHEKATRALKKRDQTRADRLRRTRDALLPGGAFQERGLGLVGLLARHGRPWSTTSRERIDPWAAATR